MAASLPSHGRVICNVCHLGEAYSFDRTRTERDGWRITNNPLSWGSESPEIVVLGFSKGPTQAGALASAAHDGIAFKGGRTSLAKILHHLSLIERPDASVVDGLIADKSGRFHFGSLIRCTVERLDIKEQTWKGTGGGMLDHFTATTFGRSVALQCSTRFLSQLPSRTKLVLMLGMGAKGSYINACKALFSAARPGRWSSLNDVTYYDDSIVVVHSEHFASQGALLPNWLSGTLHERGRLGLLAREGVAFAMDRNRTS